MSMHSHRSAHVARYARSFATLALPCYIHLGCASGSKFHFPPMLSAPGRLLDPFKIQSKIHQKSVQNGTENRTKIDQKSIKNRPKIGPKTDSGAPSFPNPIFDPILSPPGASGAPPGRVLGASWPPSWSPRAAQNHQKSMSKTRRFLSTPWRSIFSDFFRFSHHFGRKKRPKLDRKSHQKCNLC